MYIQQFLTLQNSFTIPESTRIIKALKSGLSYLCVHNVNHAILGKLPDICKRFKDRTCTGYRCQINTTTFITSYYKEVKGKNQHYRVQSGRRKIFSLIFPLKVHIFHDF